MTRECRILQTNLNHSAAAQDLLLQTMLERGFKLAIVAEPYYVLERDNWKGDENGLVAIIGEDGKEAIPLNQVGKGRGYTIVRWGVITIVGVYFLPNESNASFELYLDKIGREIRKYLPGRVLVAGDLNAKSKDWESPVANYKGIMLEEWNEEMDLVVLNRGREWTCVRRNGGSIVDVTMGSPEAARMITDWEVMVGLETLSGHRYISIGVSDPTRAKSLLVKGMGKCCNEDGHCQS